MKTKHKFIIKWDNFHNEYRASSDTLGAEDSPAGIGESPVDALEDLIDQLDEIEKRSEP